MTIGNRVVRWFSQQHTVFSWIDLQLVKDVSPDRLHFFPVFYDSVLNRVVELDDALVLLGLLSDEELVLL